MKYLIILLLLCSCGSKKKVVQDNKLLIENAETKETTLTTKNETKKDETKDISITESKAIINTLFEGKIADSSKVATIIESATDSTKTTTFRNFKEVRQVKVSNDYNSTIIGAGQLSEISNLESVLKKSSNTEQLIDVNNKSKDLEVEKPNGWTSISWGFIGIAAVIMIALIFYFWNYRKKKDVL